LRHDADASDLWQVRAPLTLNTWADKSTGETKTGLNVAAWKCERVASIGKNRERKPSAYQANRDTPSNMGNGRASRDFDDPMPF
jgi:hypothetical protein